MIEAIITIIKIIINRCYSRYKSLFISKVGKNFSLSYPIYIHNGKRMCIGNNFRAEKSVRLEAFGDSDIIIQVGNNVHINWNTHIGGLSKIVICDNVLIGSNVLITDHSHGTNKCIDDLLIPTYNRNLFSKGEVVINDNVWIGENVAVLPGVNIGSNSIIGANSVVTKSIPPNCIAVGNPARVIKQLL